MHCEELTDDVLLDCASRRVEGPALELIEGHLSRCRPCSERYIETAQVHELAGIALKVTPSKALDEKILGELEGILAAPRRFRLKPALAAAASFAFAAVSTWALLAIQPEPDRSMQVMVPDEQDLPAPNVVIRVASEPRTAPPRPWVDIAVDPPAPRVPAVVKVVVTPLIPDLNGDDKIDVADLMLLMETINEDSPIDLYDLNGDGKVDVGDKMLLSQLDPK